MIRCTCNKCGKELEHAGGLAFSPPNVDNESTKIHLCGRCWSLFVMWLDETKDE